MSSSTSLRAWLDVYDASTASQRLRDFETFQTRLMAVNQHTNLTRIELDDIEEKHFLDCLAIVDELPSQAAVCDLGSGAGFPGLVLAIVRRDCRFTLVEATGKRVQFLEAMVAELGLEHVRVLHARAEALSDHKERYDVLTARAVARLNLLLELAIPLVKVGGRFIAMKGSNAHQELEEAQTALIALMLKPPRVEVVEGPKIGLHHNLIFTKDQACDAHYPRAYAAMKKKAL
jgi:16S rRNA (guanine527-N7)-methyltransferase